jgi:NitT/TauT family transport system ATP-binding protein
MNHGTLLQVEGVDKSFTQGSPILSDLHLCVDAHQFVAIVGASGCGKSTLLRLIAGLESPDSGTISVDHEHIDYVFQDPALLPWRTLRQNVSLSLELQLGSIASYEEIDNAISLVGLSEHVNKYPHELSGGMRMRTALARSLALRPSLYLFDEPFSALDEITRENLNYELHALHSHRDFGAVFVTHNIAEAVFLSDRIHIMSAAKDGGSTITAEVSVDFGKNRQPSLRYETPFVEKCREVHEIMSSVVA